LDENIVSSVAEIPSGDRFDVESSDRVVELSFVVKMPLITVEGVGECSGVVLLSFVVAPS
jgi:hypothetical protein